jgi:PmbA protein
MHMANDVTGDFSFGASGLLVEAGGRATPVRGFTVAGNVHQLLRQIQAASRTRHFAKAMGVFACAPHVRVRGLTVGS